MKKTFSFIYVYNRDEEANTMSGSVYIYNIKTVNGSASQQNNSVINSFNIKR